MGAQTGMEKMGVADKITETGVALETMAFHLLISKKSDLTHILPRFEKTIKKMGEKGIIKAIISNYD